MEKAVKSVHLWLDRTQNSYVKTLFPRHMRDIPCAHTFIFVSSEIMSVGKSKNLFCIDCMSIRAQQGSATFSVALVSQVFFPVLFSL